MQLIHLTYTWPSATTLYDQRTLEALNTWQTHANPDIYYSHHMNPTDAESHACHIGDTVPYPVLRSIIDQAFERRTSDDTVLLFTNTDIGLKEKCWPIIEQRIRNQEAHYEECVHTRPRRPDEATSDPLTFFFPWRWWTKNKNYIAPVFFACPYWEPPFQTVIDRTTPSRENLPQCTSHVPHLFWKQFNQKRDPAFKMNHAIASGWITRRYDMPPMPGRLQYEFKTPREVNNNHGDPPMIHDHIYRKLQQQYADLVKENEKLKKKKTKKKPATKKAKPKARKPK